MEYKCDVCNYTTDRKFNYNIHIMSKKHKENVPSNKNMILPDKNTILHEQMNIDEILIDDEIRNKLKDNNIIDKDVYNEKIKLLINKIKELNKENKELKNSSEEQEKLIKLLIERVEKLESNIK